MISVTMYLLSLHSVICSVSGSQYITTFDGTRYYFSGGCTNILVTTDLFTVYLGTNTCEEADNGNCIEYVTLTIKAIGISITLTKTGRAFLGKNETELPFVYGSGAALSVHLASSIFLEIMSVSGVHIQYDFKGGRIYMILQPNMMIKTRGLCGTYNRNHMDDFMSSSNQVESVPMAFANSWKGSTQCADSPLFPVHKPCKVNHQKESYATKKCSIIRSHIFKNCHFISPESFYDQCRRDVCSCSDSKTCLCTALAHYAHVCLLHGAFIDFRAAVPECTMNCTRNMVYTLTNHACKRNCYYLSTGSSCLKLPSSGYLEGCNCPENMYFNPHIKNCVANM
ncbi:otogelin-like protein [Cetorhinus maximus]